MYIGIDMGDIGICDMFPLLWVRRKMGYYPRKSVSMEAIMEAMVHESRSFTRGKPWGFPTSMLV